MRREPDPDCFVERLAEKHDLERCWDPTKVWQRV